MIDFHNSRGWRNNNPLNIRKGEKWQGLRYNQTDLLFCQFSDQSWGYRAATKVLLSYYRYMAQQGQRFCVQTIIARWAPDCENDTSAYVRRVVELTGFDANKRLDAPTTREGAWQIGVIMAAMTCVECGCEWEQVPFYSLTLGIWMALNIAIDLYDISDIKK